VPTAAMVTGHVPLPGSPDAAAKLIAAATRAEDMLQVDAQQLAESLFADHMPTNLLLLGAAYQHGCLPVSAQAIEQAISLNGAAVETALAAFRWGRAVVIDRDTVLARVARPVHEPVVVDTHARAVVGDMGLSGPLAEVVTTRVADLTGYQDSAYSRRYVADVGEVITRATALVGTEVGQRIGLAYAVSLHKLMAYKDEYEVARLHLDPSERARIEAEFGHGARVSVLLHPPALRALGLKRKIRLRRTANAAFRTLRAARRLRGTRFDVFGYAKVRRVERALIVDYRADVRTALQFLSVENAEGVIDILKLATVVNGYEEIKIARVADFRSQMATALTALTAPAA
jgi:indolepyruvate ferredoxin oxidoreductase